MIVEGFRIMFHSQEAGYVLECLFLEESTKGFYVTFSEAKDACNEKRKKAGYEPLTKGLRFGRDRKDTYKNRNRW